MTCPPPFQLEQHGLNISFFELSSRVLRLGCGAGQHQRPNGGRVRQNARSAKAYERPSDFEGESHRPGSDARIQIHKKIQTHMNSRLLAIRLFRWERSNSHFEARKYICMRWIRSRRLPQCIRIDAEKWGPKQNKIEKWHTGHDWITPPSLKNCSIYFIK